MPPRTAAPAPHPEDALTDLAREVMRGYDPARNATLTLRLDDLAARHGLDPAAADLPVPTPVTPSMLSLAYYFSVNGFVERLAWQAREQHGAAGQASQALQAAAVMARDLAACADAAPASSNCAFLAALLDRLTRGHPDAARSVAQSRALLRDLAQRLERKAAS